MCACLSRLFPLLLAFVSAADALAAFMLRVCYVPGSGILSENTFHLLSLRNFFASSHPSTLTDEGPTLLVAADCGPEGRGRQARQGAPKRRAAPRAQHQPVSVLQVEVHSRRHQLAETAPGDAQVEGIAAPPPPPQIGATVPARVYIRFSETSEAEAAREVGHQVLG